MHICEGALSGSTSGIVVLAVGAAVTVVGTALGLRKLDYERVPRVALLSAAFFVASFLDIPLGPTNIHPLLTGLIGLCLGWAAFPALLVALFLQTFFQFGGLTTLGINTAVMALPAVACHYLYGWAVRGENEGVAAIAGLAAGATGVMFSAVLLCAALLTAGSEYRAISAAVLGVNLLLALAEGAVTASAVVFLRKVAAEVLDSSLLLAGPLVKETGRECL